MIRIKFPAKVLGDYFINILVVLLVISFGVFQISAQETILQRGILNGQAVNLPKPVYPENAREKNITGVVNVEVLVNRKGQVIFAKAKSGNSLFRTSAEYAARRAIFKPLKIRGKPVQFKGILVYNFKPSQAIINTKTAGLIEPKQAEALDKFLQANKRLSFLPKTRFEEAEKGSLKILRKFTNPNLSPYFLSADFNHDKIRDFAVVLVDEAKPFDRGEDMSKSHRYEYKLMIVIFNGLKNNTYKPVFKQEVETPLVNFLALTQEKKPRLSWQVFETDYGAIFSPTKSGYLLEDLDYGEELFNETQLKNGNISAGENQFDLKR